MDTSHHKKDPIMHVFSNLGLENEKDRERFTQMAQLGNLGEFPEYCTLEKVETWNHTMKEEDNAELEPVA